jgi:lactate dehydrogenase-like 2-hydroxyacid dehydrogenase
MAKTFIKGKVQTIFDEKRQNSLYKHQFIRVAENGTTNLFDIQFYNEKIKELQEGSKVAILSTGTIGNNVTKALKDVENSELFSHYHFPFTIERIVYIPDTFFV